MVSKGYCRDILRTLSFTHTLSIHHVPLLSGCTALVCILNPEYSLMTSNADTRLFCHIDMSNDLPLDYPLCRVSLLPEFSMLGSPHIVILELKIAQLQLH